MKTSFRRLLSLFLAACILLCCVPAAFAEGPAFTDTADAAKYVRGKMVQRETGIQFTYETDKTAVGELNEENLKAAMQKAWDEMLPVVFEHTGVGSEGDYLRQHVIQYGFNAGVSYAAGDDAVSIRFTVNATYYTTAAQESSVTAAVAKALKELDLNGKTDYEKVRAITDYICGKVAYDYENLNNDAYTLKQSAYAALINGKAVCQGYSSLFYRMALEAGLDCRILTGDADNGEAVEAHAWNLVKVGTKYYYIDPTWVDAAGTVYFLAGPDFLNDHFPDAESANIANQYTIASKTYYAATVDAQGNVTGMAGTNAIWKLAPDGTLTVSGKGKIYNNFLENDPYLSDHKEEVTAICVEEGITEIGFRAFDGFENAKTLSLPNSLETLGDSAFAFCLSLTSVEIPEKVTELPRDLFFSDYSITEIKLPRNLKKICWQALLCQRLVKIRIPASVEEIERGAFYGAGIRYVFFEGTQEQWENAVNYENNDCLKTARIIYSYRDGQTVILDEGECGEQGGNLKWTIDNQNTLTISGKGRMKDYYALLGYFPSHPWFLSPIYAAVKTIIVQDGVESISKFAFYGSNAERVILANSLTEVPGDAFVWNESIKGINIPDRLSADCFNICSELSKIESITVSDKCENYYTDERGALFLKKDKELLMVPRQCEEVVIPKETTMIQSEALKYCTEVKTIKVEPGNEVYSSDQGVLLRKQEGNSRYALKRCPAKIQMETYICPDGTKQIDSDAFSGCTTLKEIKIPGSVTTIDYAFYNCLSLERIELPYSVEKILPETFSGCRSLQTVKLSHKMTRIEEKLFFNCESLRQVYIPKNITSIDYSAFYGCPNVTLIFEETKENLHISFTGEDKGQFYANAKKEYGKMHAHQPAADPAVPASCVADGLTAGSHCSVCGAVLEEQKTVKATGHKWDTGKITQATTCTNIGETVFTCTVCKATRIQRFESTGHKAEKIAAVAPTCTTDGLTEGSVCSVCGITLKTQEPVKATGHKWDAGKIAKAATCLNNGEKVFTCIVCKETRTEEITAGHIPEKIEAVAPTCTTDGWTEGSDCAVCGEMFKQPNLIKATGHKWDDGKVTKEATAASDGEKTFTCTVCGETKTETIPKLPEEPGKSEFLIGDVNKDGEVTAADARLALRAAVGLETYAAGSREFLAADATKDGAITAEDARLILRAAVGLETLS